MASSVPNQVRPALPGDSSESEKRTPVKMPVGERLSEAADVGHHSASQNRPGSQEPSSDSQTSFTSEEGDRLACTRTTLVHVSDAVVHPERASCGGESDACEVCGSSKSEGRRVLQLEKEVERLKEALREKEQTIASLMEENIRKTAELLEVQLQKLQRSISDKDSAIAVLEIQRSSEAVSDHELEKLRGERGKLTQQLKRKVQERVDLFRKDSDHALDNLANHFQSYNKKQVCEVLRTLERTCVKLKTYIDQLLAVVLESNPNLLEGMPRIQQNVGMKLELFKMASLQELLEELHEKEQNCQSLQNYAGMLLERITEQSPNLLESITSHREQSGELLMPEH